MANDRLRNEDRWSTSIQHQHVLSGIGPTAPLNVRLDLNRVGDNNYWRDFPRSSTSLTERLLRRDAVVTTSAGPWSYSAGVYTWQTLQDPIDRITPPYDRVPSISAAYSTDLSWSAQQDVRFSLLTDATTFRANRPVLIGGLNQSTEVNGSRLFAQAKLEKVWQTPGWFVRPSAQLHMRQYQFDHAIGPAGLRQRNPSLSVPTLSLDSGLIFERDAQILGRAAIQTLEPRLFYTLTPYKQQGYLPVYDSSDFGFSESSMFYSNTYSGHDRIADLHAATLGLTTRVISPDTGTEWVSLGMAQRVRLSNQRVVLPGQNEIAERISDVLFSGTVQWHPHWTFNGHSQYNPKTRQSVRSTVGARYSPSNYRVVNAAYRVQRGSSEQLDLGWQWPLRDLMGGPRAPDLGVGRGLGPGHWYSVGRINYSLRDRRTIDLIAGFEYDAGCWVARVVLERLQQTRTQANQRIMFQLEFSGFSRLGSSPLQTLSDNIPRYQLLRQQINPPSRFERYD
jgi:LPS-assembly protein